MIVIQYFAKLFLKFAFINALFLLLKAIILIYEKKLKNICYFYC